MRVNRVSTMSGTRALVSVSGELTDIAFRKGIGSRCQRGKSRSGRSRLSGGL